MAQGRLVYLLILFHSYLALSQAPLPDNFRDELVLNSFDGAVGIEFLSSSQWIVWERSGKFWLVENGIVKPRPILDLSLEVMSSAEHGLLSMLVDPSFAETGLIYLAYVVDPWVLRNEGEIPQHPSQLEEWSATIGRVTRYQVNFEKWHVIDSTRHVLLGREISDGIPVLAPSHGIGGMCWGADNSLMLAVGDGATWVGSHTGGDYYPEFAYDSLGKLDGIIGADEDLGSYRSQYINSYSGKLLRLDPHTGQGLPSNPFFMVDDPDGPSSKVWAVGLRNPFRIVRMPGTGSEDSSIGDPGTFIIGDVGRHFYEEINLCEGPARNFGWPSFEGYLALDDYRLKKAIHPLSDSLLASTPCIDLFHFDSLLRTDRDLHGSLNLVCGQDTLPRIGPIVPLYHETPLVAYGNPVNFPHQTFVRKTDPKGQQTHLSMSDPFAGVSGSPFDGISSIAGDFYQGSTWPQDFHGRYFHGDFQGWIKMLDVDRHNGGEVHSIYPFLGMDRKIVFLKFNSYDDCLYYFVLNYSKENPQEMRRICFGGDGPPLAVIHLETNYARAPATFHLDGRASTDVEGDIVNYFWVVENDTLSRSSTFDFYIDQPRDQIVDQRVQLVVVDAAGQTDSTFVYLSLNNSPPSVTITSPIDSFMYLASGENLKFDFNALVSDEEHDDLELAYKWHIFLNHNNHTHLEITDTSKSPTIGWQTAPESLFAKYSYRVSLTVTDPSGLEGMDEVMLFPSVTTDVDEQENVMSVYPNPVDDWLSFDFSKRVQKISIVSAQGMLVRNEKDAVMSGLIDVSDLPSGLYFLVVHSQDGELTSSQFIVN